MLLKTKSILGYLVLMFFTSPLVSNAAGQINTPHFQQNSISSPQQVRDPFTPSILMFEVASKYASLNSNGFMRAPGNTPIPKMRLRGFIDQDANDPLALLEVSGARTYLVREGDDINIDPSQPNSVIRITKITRQSITVETGLLGSIRVQR